MIDRRQILAAAGAVASMPALASPPARKAFPEGFLWGTATAGHQVEGNNVNADSWVLENVRPTIFAQPSGDACDSFRLWEKDLDLVRALGLNTYRFSLEWARIQPEPDLWSTAMVDHYKAIIDGCIKRGLVPMVTFNHFTAPRWFAAQGGWVDPKSVGHFARYCDRAARALASDMGYATTLNEPNLQTVLSVAMGLPPQAFAAMDSMRKAAAKASGSDRFDAFGAIALADLPAATNSMLAGHKAGREAIKAIRPDLPVGVSLAVFDDQAAGSGSLRDEMRRRLYEPWLDAVRHDDFLGVQNYERRVWGAEGPLPTPPGAPTNWAGAEVYAPSLAGAVRYAHQATGVPIIVTEHGVGTDDDAIRQRFIPASLVGLQAAISDGVPVKGYVHWSLMDNFEWNSGYKVKFGLHSVDRASFVRTPKPSASLYSVIARANAV